MSLADNYALRKHKDTHSTETPFTCYHCGKSFKSTHTLKSHQISHDGVKPYKCKHCDKYFAKASNRTGHERRHGISTEERKITPIKCDQCDKTFLAKDNMKRHKVTHYSERPFECNQCGKGFRLKDDVKKHQLIHSEERNFSCAECGKKFKQGSALYGHIRIVHKREKRNPKIEPGRKEGERRKHGEMKQREPRKCSKCDEDLYNCQEHRKENSTMIEAMSERKVRKVKNGVHSKFIPCLECGEKPYFCKQCGEGFADDKDLLKHHSNEHPNHQNDQEIFQCKHCKSSFSKAEYYRRHHTRELLSQRKIIRVRNDQIIKECSHCRKEPYCCKRCGDRFEKASKLLRHFKNAHSDLGAGKKVFQCNHCEKSFTQPGYFRKHHILLHSEEKPLNSDTNETQKPQNHVKEVTKSTKSRFKSKFEPCVQCGQKPYICKQCGQCFAGDRDLVRHYSNEHPEHQNDTDIFQCIHCKRSFAKADYYRRHHTREMKRKSKIVRVKHNQIFLSCSQCGEEPYCCKKCGSRFEKVSKLMNHFRKDHSDLEVGKVFQCNHCEKSFSQAGYLLQHHRLHTEGKTQNYVNDLTKLKSCSICGEKPYYCNICKNTFERSKELTLHVKTLHQGLSAKESISFPCNHCEKPFTKVKLFLKHHRIHTKHHRMTLFDCSHCAEKPFENKEEFEQHMRTHSRLARMWQPNKT